MAPIVGVFAVAAVAGFGATLGHGVARHAVVPLAGRAAAAVRDAAQRISTRSAETRRLAYDDFAAPPDAAG
jgi:hypothetical protein